MEEGTQSGAAINEVCRRHQIRRSRFYRWERPEPRQGRQVHEATQADEVWHVDLMYSWVNGRWCFLVTVFGSYSRCMIRWELA